MNAQAPVDVSRTRSREPGAGTVARTGCVFRGWVRALGKAGGVCAAVSLGGLWVAGGEVTQARGDTEVGEESPAYPYTISEVEVGATSLDGGPVSPAGEYHYAASGLGLELPDGGGVGTFVQHAVTGLPGRIVGVTVSLDLSGGWSGDLYAYLNLGGAHAVLLNRVGRTAADPVGYGDRGFQVQFADDALNGDIHAYRQTYPAGPPLSVSGALLGEWAPDGRITDPDLVLDTDARTATLGVFEGLEPNGEWTLFLADMAPGSVHVLSGWELTIAFEVIPEPSPAALGLAGGCWFALVRGRRRHRRDG